MNLFRFRAVTGCLLIIASIAVVSSAAAKTVVSDLSMPEKRRSFVEQISLLAKSAKPAPLPADLALPFSPPGFDQTDAQERAATAAAAVAGQSAPVKQATSDRDTLEQLAARVVPNGSMRDKNGDPMLTFGTKMVKKGAHITVTLPNGQQHDLELISIDNTTFTLRLNREEITRLIKPAKSP